MDNSIKPKLMGEKVAQKGGLPVIHRFILQNRAIKIILTVDNYLLQDNYQIAERNN